MFWTVARLHASKEDFHAHARDYDGASLGCALTLPYPHIFHANPVLDPKLVVYHAALGHKYKYVASHPWLSIGPDPPAPEP